ncbi:hypothetical protein [Flavobacterium aquatile]|uniref:hypothetical protein n=1 Tax=Flavobacterium aquatile TaxID=245 RepID=UPI00068BCD01|nr:hypothetical protein [Flavobacterium aquatile]OXA66578.1 hypothetical protein B0A61_10220 [Flavobacterium aquatile LMG 4008 = ATCC 11947]GEC78557.1 hypothetical protein FAQ01_14270 [Flavobacterium aquatile]
MKTNFLKALALSVAFFAIGCSSSDDDNTPSVPNLEGTTLQGNITADLNIPAGNYTLKGVVTVKAGATLTIEPGSTFTVSTADQALGANYLQIEQGAKLIANGTSSSPIVFTAQSATVGAWGGIIMNGKAGINVAGGTEIAEAGGLIYGGTDNADNSGSLKYVRVEYAGAAITGGTAEYNAFSFFGLGTGTVLENLQAYKGADDAFEFFGGTVNATNLAAFGCEDDNIDWDRGYRGTISNIWIIQPSNGDFAFECSNLPVEFNSSPRANPTVSNVTITGSGNATKAAFNFKEGTAGNISNVVATGVGYGVDLRNQLAQFQDGSLKVTNANITFITALTKNGITGDTTNINSIVTVNAGATGANTAPFTAGTWLRNL